MGAIKNSLDNLIGEDIFQYTPINFEEKESEFLDLDNPIFIYYVSIGGMPRQRAEEEISKVRAMFRYKNATIWIVPTETKTTIECIWKGKEVEKNEKANRTV